MNSVFDGFGSVFIYSGRFLVLVRRLSVCIWRRVFAGVALICAVAEAGVAVVGPSPLLVRIVVGPV